MAGHDSGGGGGDEQQHSRDASKYRDSSKYS
jgi:hypothetical protein